MSTAQFLQIDDVIEERADGTTITEWRVTEIRSRGPQEIDVVNALGVRNHLTKREFSEGCASGRFHLLRRTQYTSQLTRNVSETDLATLSEYEQDQVAKREKILSLLRTWRKDGHTLNQAIEMLPRHIHSESIPSKRTLQRWLKLPEDGALIPLQRGWRTGRQRLHTDVEKAIKQAIETLIARKSPNSISARSVRELTLQILKRNEWTQKLSVSKRAVGEYLRNSVPWSSRLREVLDSATYRAITRIAEKRVLADHPFEVVEIDSTELPLNIVNEEGQNIGRPTLYGAVDVATGMPIGMVVSSESPSAALLELLIEDILQPKRDYPDAPYGKPAEIVVDQGADNRSRIFVNACAQLQIRYVLAQGEKAWAKPNIERLHKTVQTELANSLPGATINEQTGEKDPRMPSRGGSMTLKKLRAKLREYFYDIYPTRPFTLNNPRAPRYPGIVTPQQLWKHLTSTVPPITSASVDDIRRAFSHSIGEYKVGRAGIEIKDIAYQSEELAQYYLSNDPGHRTVKVFQHPATVGHIWVAIPGENRLLRVKAKDAGFDDKTVADWDEFRRQYNLQTKDAKQAFEAAKARIISDAWENDAMPIKSNKLVHKARRKASKESKRGRALERSGEDTSATQNDSQERRPAIKIPNRIVKIRPVSQEAWVSSLKTIKD